MDDDEFSASQNIDLASRRGTIGNVQKLYSSPVCRADVYDWKGHNPWTTSCCCSPCADPLYCLSAQLFLPCRIYQQRKVLLQRRGDDYQCCAGICGKQCTDPCALYVRGNDELCLLAEVTCCPCWALFGNRWMVMQHYNLVNDPLDKMMNKLACPLTVLSFFWQDDIFENLVYLPLPLCGGWIMTQHYQHMKIFGYPVGQGITRKPVEVMF